MIYSFVTGSNLSKKHLTAAFPQPKIIYIIYKIWIIFLLINSLEIFTRLFLTWRFLWENLQIWNQFLRMRLLKISISSVAFCKLCLSSTLFTSYKSSKLDRDLIISSLIFFNIYGGVLVLSPFSLLILIICFNLIFSIGSFPDAYNLLNPNSLLWTSFVAQ